MDFTKLKEKFGSILGKGKAKDSEASEEDTAVHEGGYELDDSDESDNPKEEGMNPKQLVIRIAIAGIVGFLGYDEYMKQAGGGGDDPLANLPDPPKKKKVVKKKPIAQRTVVKKPTPKPVEKAVEVRKPIAQPIARPKVERPKPVAQPVKPKTVEPVEDPFAGLDDFDTDDSMQIEEPKVVSKPTPKPKPVVKQMGEQQPMQKDVMPNVRVEKIPDEPTGKTYVDILKKIKVEPGKKYEKPNYFISGRGLVYDCLKRRWVCVDRENYFRCASVQKSDEQKGRSPSCVSKDIFYSSEHCSRGQMQKIHKGIEALECKK